MLLLKNHEKITALTEAKLRIRIRHFRRHVPAVNGKIAGKRTEVIATKLHPKGGYTELEVTDTNGVTKTFIGKCRNDEVFVKQLGIEAALHKLLDTSLCWVSNYHAVLGTPKPLLFMEDE